MRDAGSKILPSYILHLASCILLKGPMNTTGPPARLNNRYRLVEWIGESEAGVVYRAHDDVHDRDVVIKFLPPEHFANADAGGHFLQEVRALTHLSHPNIVTVFDVGIERGWHYIVRELLTGHHLHEIAAERGGSFSVQDTLKIARGVLDALVYAHAQGVVHGDIKLDNLWLTPDGIVKVADFGTATPRDTHPDIHTDLSASRRGVETHCLPVRYPFRQT